MLSIFLAPYILSNVLSTYLAFSCPKPNTANAVVCSIESPTKVDDHNIYLDSKLFSFIVVKDTTIKICDDRRLVVASSFVFYVMAENWLEMVEKQPYTFRELAKSEYICILCHNF